MAVWLDPNMLSVYKFYQFWLNRPDVEMASLLKAFTFLPKAEIERLVEATDTNPGAREARGCLPGKSRAWCMARSPPARPLTLRLRCSAAAAISPTSIW